MVKDEVQGEGARLVRTLHLTSEREVPRGQVSDNCRSCVSARYRSEIQTISQLLSTMNGIVNLLRVSMVYVMYEDLC